MSLFYFLPDFITWWYGRGLQDYFNFLSVLFSYLMNAFSLKTIFRTFFSPWKKMVEKKGKGIDAFFSYLLDNIISRGVAIAMRLMLIFVFFISMILYFFRGCLCHCLLVFDAGFTGGGFLSFDRGNGLVRK